MPIYTPNGCFMTVNEPRRTLFSSKIDQEEIRFYDDSTYLFDAVRVDDEPLIHLYGPPLINLKKELGYPLIIRDGQKLKYHVKTTALSRFTEWTVKSEPSESNKKSLELSFSDGIVKTISINSVESFQPGSRVLTAIQKDNDIRWILDWYQHYRDEFGVHNLVIYDNGSANVRELEAVLPESATLVKWNYPYGPPTSHDNKFAQVGALNHCRKVFGRKSIIFNFDIDELLVDRTGQVNHLVECRNVLYFSSYFVPHQDELPEDYSFGSYSLRFKKPRLFARKYIFKASKSTGVLPHYVQTHRMKWVDYFVVYLRKMINNSLRKTRKSLPLSTLFLKIVLAPFITGRYEKAFHTEDAYFLHFLGITTGWKPRMKRLKPKKRIECIEDQFLAGNRSLNQ